MNWIKEWIKIFRYQIDLEGQKELISSVYKGSEFKGTNLWVLICAIFLASLGLNVNSAAVIIGAMLISPLMGPIMGMGLGVAINDIFLLNTSLKNYVFALVTSLVTSTLYFLITPISDAHSELLARTSPNFYDVLIALFGGLAGIIASATRNKGNVLPGVAIATALMPPLCTAGYGIATLNFNYFLGAFYLFFINSVFIGLATMLGAKLVGVKRITLQQAHLQRKHYNLLIVLAIITFIPSVYFGYKLVQNQRLIKSANQFLSDEFKSEYDYILKSEIKPDKRSIKVIIAGKEIDSLQKEALRKKLLAYDLVNWTLEINQGFGLTYPKDRLLDYQNQEPWVEAMQFQQTKLEALRQQLDSLRLAGQKDTMLSLKVILRQYPEILEVSDVYTIYTNENINRNAIRLKSKYPLKASVKNEIIIQLKEQTQHPDLEVIFEVKK
jgi:uncharacterized hydrophobic protein (TIGR00271 family)